MTALTSVFTTRTAHRPGRRALALTVPLAVGALVLASAPAGATSTPAQIATSKANGVGYLKTLQASDGSFMRQRALQRVGVQRAGRRGHRRRGPRSGR